MPSTLTETQILNLALSKLGPGGGYVQDFATDQTVQAQAGRRTYAAIRDLVIESHPWRFARARAAIAADSVAPAWGFTKQFELPNDFLRILAVEDFQLEYEIEGDRLLTDAEGPLNIRYLRRITDASKFTPTFIAALATRLAAELAPTITKSKSQREALLTEYVKVDLAQAKKTDMFGAVSQPAPDGAWLDSRL